MIGVDLKWSQQPRETWMWQEYHICGPQGKHQPKRGWKVLQGSAWNALNRSWQELGVRRQECTQDFHADLNKMATVEIIFCGRIGTSRMWETQELVLNQRNVYIFFLLTMAFFSLGLGYLRVNAVFNFIILMSEEVFIDDGNSYIYSTSLQDKLKNIPLFHWTWESIKNHQPSAGTSLSRFFRDLGGANLCSSYFFWW